MCLSPEQRRQMDALDQEDRTVVAYKRLGQRITLSAEVREHHADLVWNRTRSEAGRLAYEAHRAEHRAEAERIRAERNK